MRNSASTLTVLANSSGCNLTIKSPCCDVTNPSIYNSLHEKGRGEGGDIGCDTTDFHQRLISKTFFSGCNITLQGGKLQMSKEMIPTV